VALLSACAETFQCVIFPRGKGNINKIRQIFKNLCEHLKLRTAKIRSYGRTFRFGNTLVIQVQIFFCHFSQTVCKSCTDDSVCLLTFQTTFLNVLYYTSFLLVCHISDTLFFKPKYEYRNKRLWLTWAIGVSSDRKLGCVHYLPCSSSETSNTIRDTLGRRKFNINTPTSLGRFGPSSGRICKIPSRSYSSLTLKTCLKSADLLLNVVDVKVLSEPYLERSVTPSLDVLFCAESRMIIIDYRCKFASFDVLAAL